LSNGAARMRKTPLLPLHSGMGILELLVFIALLFLVVVTAVPMQNRAKTRSGVARAISDVMRLGAGLDVYRMDHGAYPPSVDSPLNTPIPADLYGKRYRPPRVSHRRALTPLTSPVAYLTSVNFDAPFRSQAWEITEAEQKGNARSYWYCNYADFWQTARGAVAPHPLEGYLVLAFGPSSRGVAGISAPYRELLPRMISAAALNRPNSAHIYDPSNGLFSSGNIPKFGGRLGLEDGVPYFPSGGVK
jgi:hypothetical protein